MRPILAALCLIPALLMLPVPPAWSETCSGCACRGGPGYRDAKGHCVAHKQLYSRCGLPPTTRCTFEGAAHVGRNAVPPDWSPAQHAQWLSARRAPPAVEAEAAPALAVQP